MSFFVESGEEFCVIKIRVGTPAITTSCALLFGCRCHFSWGAQAHHWPHPTHPHARWRQEMSENGQIYHIIVFSTVLTEVSRRFRTRGPITNGYKCTLVHKVLLKGFSSCVCKAPEPAKHPQFQPVSSSSTASSYVTFETSRSHSASTASKNIRRSINLVCVESC